MLNKKIAIIGVGNMGRALAVSLLKKSVISAENLILSNPRPKNLDGLKGVFFTHDNKEAVQKADIIFLAVKPQIITGVMEEIRQVISEDQLIISVAAGIEIKKMKQVLGEEQHVVRAMPNLCATISESMSCWVVSKEVTVEEKELAQLIFQAIGKEHEVTEESLLDQVTAISGSGPAYVFYLAELLTEAGVKVGLSRELAYALVLQTLKGSAELLKGSDKSAAVLRQQVTSKGGTTEAAFGKINQANLPFTFQQAVSAAYKRSRSLRLGLV